MYIKELQLNNYRNYRELTIEPHSGVNLFYGRNGSGKTNLLEAVHYCALGRSHRITSDLHVVKSEEKFASSTVVLKNNLGERTISVRFHPDESQKKEILIDQKKIARFSDMMGCLRCVIFSPEDLSLIKEGPSARRKYLDMMISQINQRYFIALQQYRACVDQRNAMLKKLRMNPSEDQSVLSAFEETMAGPALIIIRERKRMVEMLSGMTGEIYRRVSDSDECFQVAYHGSIKDENESEEQICRMLRESRTDDIRNGITSVGPHRDDLMLMMNHNIMKQFASQGQIRTAALSLKLSQMHILKEISGDEPVLLLDDVMSELDQRRRACLLKEIDHFQTFIACTEREEVDQKKVSCFWYVSSDQGEASVQKK